MSDVEAPSSLASEDCDGILSQKDFPSEPLTNGFYWRAPWNDVYVYDVRWQSYTENVDALSADDLQV